MSETGDGHTRNIAGGFVPRHAETFATAGALADDEDCVRDGVNAAGFRVGQAGDVFVVDEFDEVVPFYAVQVGEFVDQQFKTLLDTSTAQKITVSWL